MPLGQHVVPFLLEVFSLCVSQAEELRQAVLPILNEKSGLRINRSEDSRLRAAAKAIQYEDWAVDFNLVCLWLHLYN